MTNPMTYIAIFMFGCLVGAIGFYFLIGLGWRIPFVRQRIMQAIHDSHPDDWHSICTPHVISEQFLKDVDPRSH